VRNLTDRWGKLDSTAIAVAIADITDPDLLVVDRQLAMWALVEEVREIAYQTGYDAGSQNAYDEAAEAYSGYDDGYSDGYDAGLSAGEGLEL